MHGTTPKAIRTLNNLKTDMIKVGDKLKMPPKGTTASTDTTSPPAPPPLPPLPAPNSTSPGATAH
jgi:LysM repeat protein